MVKFEPGECGTVFGSFMCCFFLKFVNEVQGLSGVVDCFISSM